MQKHLVDVNPLKLAEMFAGVNSIDFELLSVFDEKTAALRPNLQKWSDWLDTLVDYYQHHEVSWCLPQIDLFTRAIENGQIYNCKCNCCDRRTFTLNPNGTTGFCPDNSYISPVSTVGEMAADWKAFEEKAHVAFIERLASLSTENCYKCEHFNECGGNCEDYFFDDTGECPLSKKVITRIKNNRERFIYLLDNRASKNLAEMEKES
jgi:radical SAM protein with 4Fe4S-binding SPASM domain